MADLPTMADLAALSDADLRLLAQRLGVSQAHVERVSAAVARAVSRLVGANLPSETLVQQVVKATDRAIRREMEKVTRDLVRQYTFREEGTRGDTRERWISIMDGDQCDDCEARHGHVQTHAEWEADGLPGTKNTECNGNCRCELRPDVFFQEGRRGGGLSPAQRRALPSEADAQSGPGDVDVVLEFIQGLETQ